MPGTASNQQGSTVEPLLKHFALKDELHFATTAHNEIAITYARLAERIVHAAARTAERTIALRKLLEARDATLRALDE